jgi:hypothetical protein
MHRSSIFCPKCLASASKMAFLELQCWLLSSQLEKRLAEMDEVCIGEADYGEAMGKLVTFCRIDGYV